MSDEKQRCHICKEFNCGEKCTCKCHYGTTPKIRHDLETETQKSEEASMEGLSSLFG